MNHIPSPDSIIKNDEKKNDWLIEFVACSDTESTRESLVVKNGLIAFRYLNDGKLTTLISLLIIKNMELIIIREINRRMQFRFLFSKLLFN